MTLGRWLLRSRTWGLPLLLFTVAVLAVYVASPVVQSGDSRLVVYEADSLLREGNRDVSEFGPIVHGWPCYVEHGQVISRFPYGAAFATAPLLGVVRLVDSVVGADVTASMAQQQPRNLEKALASIFSALAALGIVLLAREMTVRFAPAAMMGVLFAFGTGCGQRRLAECGNTAHSRSSTALRFFA